MLVLLSRNSLLNLKINTVGIFIICLCFYVEYFTRLKHKSRNRIIKDTVNLDHDLFKPVDLPKVIGENTDDVKPINCEPSDLI